MSYLRFFSLLCLLCVLTFINHLPISYAANSSIVTLEIYHMSDYHSHALPGYAEGDYNRGGVARVIAFLREARKHSKNVLVLSGGDTINLNNPIWSDAYTCTEWGWFNGVLDGMALGNHEFDYGAQTFNECVNRVTYPIFSSGLVFNDSGKSLLPEYQIYERSGIKIGVFAVAGNDFPSIVKRDLLPNNTRWVTGEEKLKRVAEIVKILREKEKVNIVISSGHQYLAEDFAMARQIPGIDLILGTHGHLKAEFTKIEGTNTYFISPYQYLNYLSHVSLQLNKNKIIKAKGELITITKGLPEDIFLAEKVQSMYEALKLKYPERFEILGEAKTLIDNTDIDKGETQIGNFVTDLARKATKAHVFFHTSSSFRAAIAPGQINRETFLTALPYNNILVTATMTGEQLLDLLTFSISQRGSDTFCQTSGLRYTINTTNNTASDVQILIDPSNIELGYKAIDPKEKYLVSTANYLAYIANGYKERFAVASNLTKTDIELNKLVINYIRQNSPISVNLDGRVKIK
ncbi:MAG: bifunctional metallophosphatase/5'-nucleotidase [Acidobacteria bacterium]|nr:bifunctional metallophosphatase/5'-nucleotidase [Acidobacteriota bacterium]